MEGMMGGMCVLSDSDRWRECNRGGTKSARFELIIRNSIGPKPIGRSKWCVCRPPEFKLLNCLTETI